VNRHRQPFFAKQPLAEMHIQHTQLIDLGEPDPPKLMIDVERI
jgi:hypothetical protein